MPVPERTAVPATLGTPLVWLGGAGVLAVTLWLTSIIALFRSIGALIRP